VRYRQRLSGALADRIGGADRKADPEQLRASSDRSRREIRFLALSVTTAA
jgi:hypothetical protein